MNELLHEFVKFVLNESDVSSSAEEFSKALEALNVNHKAFNHHGAWEVHVYESQIEDKSELKKRIKKHEKLAEKFGWLLHGKHVNKYPKGWSCVLSFEQQPSMKYMNRQSLPDELWHATSESDARSIMKNGFKPTSKAHYTLRTYFATDKQTSINHWTRYMMGETVQDSERGALLKVNISELPDNINFVHDHEFGAEKVAVYTDLPIDAKYVKFVKTLNSVDDDQKDLINSGVVMEFGDHGSVKNESAFEGKIIKFRTARLIIPEIALKTLSDYMNVNDKTQFIISQWGELIASNKKESFSFLGTKWESY